MKVYLNPQHGLSKAMDRIALAISKRLPPGCVLTESENEADLLFLHVIGYPETAAAVERLEALGKKFVIIQYCLRSTTHPNTADWVPLWQKAAAVWSYYNLPSMCFEDHAPGYIDEKGQITFNFYYSPLGSDASVFQFGGDHSRWTAFTTGYVAESESVGEVAQAVFETGGSHYHLGPNLQLVSDAVSISGIPDDTLCSVLQSTKYVFGLRKIEGFELPAVEGLLCGARPVVYDAPHYREWYGDFAEYIVETEPVDIVRQIVELITKPYRSVSKDERDRAANFFNWDLICKGLWHTIQNRIDLEYATVSVSSKRRMLWIGDAGVSTGFAKSTHHILSVLRKTWDVHVLGINYLGDPHDLPFPIYPCYPGGDFFGLGRIVELSQKISPDVIIVQNDPWNFPEYFKKTGNVPVVGIVAVDGLNCRGKMLNGLRSAVFWTEFGRNEANLGGYTGHSAVVPLGVDTALYRPGNKNEARRKMFSGPNYERLKDAFIVGNINRNQPRKRLDLTIQYFAEWCKTYKITDAYLYLHVCPTGEDAYDVIQLMHYYGMNSRLILAQPEIRKGIPEQDLVSTYQTFDVQVSTTQGEGFGLTTLEGMSCGIPQIVPNWSALGEICKDAAALIPCTSTIATDRGINVIGGVADKAYFIEALHEMYSNPTSRAGYQKAGYDRANEPRFDWLNIAKNFDYVLNEVL